MKYIIRNISTSTILTFIRTYRKSHIKELWGLLGPQDLVLCPYNNRKTIRAFSIGIYMQSVLKKNDDFIPPGSQKTPRVPFKLKDIYDQSYAGL